RSALLAARYDQLPECDDLHGAGSAEKNCASLALCLEPGRYSLSRFLRDNSRLQRSLCPDREETQNLCEKTALRRSPFRLYSPVRTGGSAGRKAAGASQTRGPPEKRT